MSFEWIRSADVSSTPAVSMPLNTIGGPYVEIPEGQSCPEDKMPDWGPLLYG